MFINGADEPGELAAATAILFSLGKENFRGAVQRRTMAVRMSAHGRFLPFANVGAST